MIKNLYLYILHVDFPNLKSIEYANDKISTLVFNFHLSRNPPYANDVVLLTKEKVKEKRTWLKRWLKMWWYSLESWETINSMSHSVRQRSEIGFISFGTASTTPCFFFLLYKLMYSKYSSWVGNVQTERKRKSADKNNKKLFSLLKTNETKRRNKKSKKYGAKRLYTFPF